jgi:hypothetical protein
MAMVLGIGLSRLCDAGMPAPTLSDVPRVLTLSEMSRERMEVISFFLLALAVSVWLIRLIWNAVARDFPSMPRLTYAKSLGLISLWGLLFLLVLTMISGARELMTPGAWKKEGLTYKLSEGPHPGEPSTSLRHEKLQQWRTALWQLAEEHQGQLPQELSADEMDPQLWETPDASQVKYIYVGGRRVDGPAAPIVYEPGIYGRERLVLMTTGEIRNMPIDQIQANLAARAP